MPPPRYLPVRGAPAGDGLGSRHPASWAPSSQGNRGRRGSCAPQGESQRRVGSGCVGGHGAGHGHPQPVDAGGPLIRRDSCQSHRAPLIKRQASPGGRRRWEGNPGGAHSSGGNTEAVGPAGRPPPAPGRKPSQQSQGPGLDRGGQPEAPAGTSVDSGGSQGHPGAGLSRDPGPPLRLQLRGPQGPGNGELQRQ